MINNNAIDIFYEKQHKLVLTSIDLRSAAKDLLTDIQFLYPELCNTTTVTKLNALCDRFHNQIFSKDGDCNE